MPPLACSFDQEGFKFFVPFSLLKYSLCIDLLDKKKVKEKTGQERGGID